MKENRTIESKLKRLEDITKMLESDDLGIEESLKLFQEGMQLGKECKKSLTEIELKVQKVIGESAEGPLMEDFDG